jgi:hypothetical protein
MRMLFIVGDPNYIRHNTICLSKIALFVGVRLTESLYLA